MSINRNELIREYAKAIIEGNAAIFAGAGLSRPSGYVDWKDLLRPLALDIGLDVDKESDLLLVAQYYKNKRMNNAVINQTILDAFSKDVKINENIQIISRLPISTYWTTNYDELLETGIRQANRNPDVKFESDQLTQILHNRDAVVYKMHGDVKRPTTAVLTKSDYELYAKNRSLFRTVLQGDLVSKRFLFIGFSFEDPNIEYVLSQIRTCLYDNGQEHYCLFRKVQKSYYDSDDDYNYAVNKQELQVENLKFYGIQTVLIDSFDEIPDILKDIERRVKQRNVYISGAAEEFKSPWNETNADDLARKIASSLITRNYRVYSGFGLGIGSSVINGALETIRTKKYCHIDDNLVLKPFPQNITDPADRKPMLSKYREEISSDTGVSIFIFGNKRDKTTDKIIVSEGCWEEYELAKANGHIIIPIGSTGYAAKQIYDDVKSNLSNYSYLSDDIMDKLGTETDVDAIISHICEILNSINA